MKNLILILTLCVMAKTSFAKTVHPSIEDDRAFSFESESQDSQREVANTDSDETVETKKEVEMTEREIASDEEVFEKSNESGIRYWKY